jgi:hypothetical protein
MADEQNPTGNEGQDSAPNGDAGQQPVTSVAIADLKTAGLADSYFTPEGTLNTKDLIEHLSDRTALRTAADERAAGIPQDGKYDFALPKDFKLPDSMKVSDDFLKSWGVSDAKAQQFATFAKDNGYSQKEVTEFVRNWALADVSDKLASAKTMQASYDAEMAKLGANVKDRWTNAKAFLAKSLGSDGMADVLLGEVSSAASFEALEKLINLKAGQLANQTSGDGPDANAQNKELAARIGKEPDMGKKLLNAHFSAQK